MADAFIAVLVTGEHREIELPSRTGTVGHALERLDEWIATADGGWIQTRYIVEVRPIKPPDAGGERVLDELRDAAGTLAGSSDSPRST